MYPTNHPPIHSILGTPAGFYKHADTTDITPHTDFTERVMHAAYTQKGDTQDHEVLEYIHYDAKTNQFTAQWYCDQPHAQYDQNGHFYMTVNVKA